MIATAFEFTLRADDLRCFQMGDDRFFTRLHEHFNRQLRRDISRILQRPDDIDDVLQDTWARIFEQRTRFANRGSLEGWLRRICRSVCVDWLRAERRRCGATVYLLEMTVGVEAMEQQEALQNHQSIQYLYQLVENELAALPNLQFEVAIYRWLLGYSTKQSAACAHVAVGTVKAALHQARLKIRAQLPVRITEDGWQLDRALDSRAAGCPAKQRPVASASASSKTARDG